MNHQPNNYAHYPPPPAPQNYQYSTNPYAAQQQPYPAYPAAQQHQIQQQQAQFLQAFQPNVSQSQQVPAQQRAIAPAIAPQLQQQISNTRSHTSVEGVTPAGHRAPPAEDLESQLRTALQDDNAQTEHEGDDGASNDEDEDDGQNGAERGEEPVFNLPPPPEGNYPNEAELEKALHSWSLEHGYELVRRASKKNAAGKTYKRYFHCSKYGKLANTGKLTEETRVRRARKSQRSNCPMSLAVVALEPSNPHGQWQVRHRKTHHNHGPMDAVTMTGHRRRARLGGMEKAIDGLFQIGTPTAQVLQFLERTNPDGLFTRADVANMKLKFKKYGTCVTQGNSLSRPSDRGGHITACIRCRRRKCKCDSARPTCEQCRSDGLDCVYDQEAVTREQPRVDIDASIGPDDAQMELEPIPEETADQEITPPTQSSAPQRRGRTHLGEQRDAAEQILRDLQAFQTEHVKAKRLELTSSSVEILAQSSCGNGSSYKTVPIMGANKDWQTWSDAFLEASQKENTYDTLMGSKGEPAALVENPDMDVEDWNEYIKQVAIYNRRNGLLLGSMWSTLSPAFRTRIKGFKSAADAWGSLEELCCPRGSENAYKMYNDLHDITLAGCGGDLQSYIGRLETAWIAFGKLKRSQQSQHGRSPARSNMLAKPHGAQVLAGQVGASGGSGADLVTEESICFIFLRGLGDRYRRQVDHLCQTSNIGGFGTGYRVGFRELTKKVVEWDGLQRRSG